MYLSVRKVVVALLGFFTIVSSFGSISLTAHASEGLTDEQIEFIEKFYPLCIEQAIDHNVPWQTPMAQAIIESGTGTSDLAKDYHNFHGLTKQSGGYQHFSTDEEGWIAYFDNLESCTVYAKNGVHETFDDPYAMLDVLVESGYAEDEKYLAKISKTIGLVDDWRQQEGLPTATEYADQIEAEAEAEYEEYLAKLEYEKEVEKIREKITNLQPRDGYAGIIQVINEIPIEIEEENQDNNDEKEERQYIAALFNALIFML